MNGYPQIVDIWRIRLYRNLTLGNFVKWIIKAWSLCLGLFNSRFIGKQLYNNTNEVLFRHLVLL